MRDFKIDDFYFEIISRGGTSGIFLNYPLDKLMTRFGVNCRKIRKLMRLMDKSNVRFGRTGRERVAADR